MQGMMASRLLIGPLVCATLLAPAVAVAATRSYIVTDFDMVRLEAPIDVAVETGRGVSARAEGNADLLERIDLAVSARILTIRLKPATFSGRPEGQTSTTRLTITVPTLHRVQLDGAGSLRARGLDKARAEVTASGGGSIAVSDIQSDILAITQLGSGSIALSGKAKSVVMRVSGAGALNAGALTSSDLELTLEGAATVSATADRAAKIRATGPGTVTIAGKAACVVTRTGNGAVNCGGKDY